MSTYPKVHPKMRRPNGRMPNPKPGQLQVGWAREGRTQAPELFFCYGGYGANPRDNAVIVQAFSSAENAAGNTLIEELVARGYDLSTLRFSVEKLPE